MGMRETLRRRTRLRGIIRGVVLAAFFVAANGFAAFNWIPSSYKQFTWEAYAGVVYGGSCVLASDCESGFCVKGICCNTICDQPSQTCETGFCAPGARAGRVASGAAAHRRTAGRDRLLRADAAAVWQAPLGRLTTDFADGSVSIHESV